MAAKTDYFETFRISPHVLVDGFKLGGPRRARTVDPRIKRL
jgi:hypothetical protein